MEANTIGIEILPRVSRSQFPGIKRSKNRLLAALSDFYWIARQNRPAGLTDSPRSFNVEVQWWSRRIVHLRWGLEAMSLPRPSIEIRCDLITTFLGQ
jgi:hypothetical protein